VLLSGLPRAEPSRLAWLKRTPIAVVSGRINQNWRSEASFTIRPRLLIARRAGTCPLLCPCELHRMQLSYRVCARSNLARISAVERSRFRRGRSRGESGFSQLHIVKRILRVCLGLDLRVHGGRSRSASLASEAPVSGFVPPWAWRRCRFLYLYPSRVRFCAGCAERSAAPRSREA
jgi:hypothetical protein